MVRYLMLCSIAALLLCSVVALTVPTKILDAEDLPASQRQVFTGRPCGRCPRVCYADASKARDDCRPMSPCRRGQNCRTRRCTRADGTMGLSCRRPPRPPTVAPPLPPIVAPAPPPIVAPAPPPVVAPPVVVVPPVVAPSITPSPSVTPTTSPSLTPSPSVSPTTSVTPSVTPTSSVTPSPSQSCEFTLAGTIGVTATSGRCTCGTSVATVTVLAPVSNEGGPLPNPNEGSMPAQDIQMEAVDCYNGCVNDLFALSCDPGSFATFAADGQAIVNSCCERCRNTRDIDTGVPGPGEGVSAATNQCRLATAQDM